MSETFTIGDIPIEIIRKRIKNIYIYIHPPVGKVKVTAPYRASLRKIQEFVRSRINWIRKSRQQIRSQEFVPAQDYSAGSSHLLWGKRYPLELVRTDGLASVQVRDDALVVKARTLGKRAIKDTLDAFYASQVEEAATPLFAKWTLLMRVELNSFSVRTMKTLWGSCTPTRQTIRLNSELAKHNPVCLEYIVVHELVHLLEPSHNHRFHAFMDRFMPDWRTHQGVLDKNRPATIDDCAGGFEPTPALA